MNTKHKRTLIAIFSAGVVFRLVFWINGLLHLPIGSDEAMLGLMAKHVFSGEFPLMIWVQPHGGALETYLTAPFYLLFGPGKLTVRLLPFVYSVFFMWLVYLIGRDFLGRRAGLAGAALAAVPPAYVSIVGSLGIPMNLPPFLGSAFMLFMAYRAVKIAPDENRRMVCMMLAGLAGGLAFWVHLIAACAVASIVLFLFLDDKFFFIRKPFLAFCACFLLGSFPLLVSNFMTDFAVFRMSPARDLSGTLMYLRTCVSYTLPRAWGFEVPTYMDSRHFLGANRFIAGSYAFLALGLALYGAAARLKGSRFFFKRGEHHPDGAWLLVSISVICLIVFARSSRSDSYAIRYIIYTFIGFLPLIGFAIASLSRKSRALGVLLAGFMISFHLLTSIMLMRAWADADFTEGKLNLPDNRGLISSLGDAGITHGYMHYWLSYPLVFRTDGEIVMSPAYDERFGRYRHPYLDEVESADEVSFVFHPRAGLRAEWFRDKIGRAGGEFEEMGVDNFTVFYGFTPPFEGRLNKIDGGGFQFSASHNPEELAALHDSDESTRWASRAPQAPGMFVEADMGGVFMTGGVELGFGRWGHDYPRGADVYVSEDGEEWARAASVPEIGGSVYWDGLSNPRIFVGGSSYRFVFDPVPARMVRIVQTGAHNVFDWSLVKIDILEAEAASSADSGKVD